MDIPRYSLNDGHDLPVIGFGTAGLRGDDAVAAVSSALDTGYRLVDTAVNYENEAEVGEAIRRSDVRRDEIVVCSKIPGRHHGYDDAIRSTRESFERLGIDRLDLHLIHWPNPGRDRYHEAWRALVDLQRDGLVRSIGVSNFTHGHLQRIVDETGVTPAVNQIELHPYFPQPEMQQVDDDLGIVTESWSPLGKRQAPFTEPPVASAAERHGVTPARCSSGGASSRETCRSPSRPRPRGSARTSTSSGSSSPTTRSRRSAGWPGPTVVSSAATRTPRGDVISG